MEVVDDSGKAYVFKVDESNGSATLIDSFPSNDPYEGGGFAYTVSLDDGKLVVASKRTKKYFTRQRVFMRIRI